MSRARDEAWRQGVEAAQRALREGPQAALRREVAAHAKTAAIKAARGSLASMTPEDRAAVLAPFNPEQQP